MDHHGPVEAWPNSVANAGQKSHRRMVNLQHYRWINHPPCSLDQKGVSKNGGTPKWMVYIGKSTYKWLI